MDYVLSWLNIMIWDLNFIYRRCSQMKNFSSLHMMILKIKNMVFPALRDHGCRHMVFYLHTMKITIYHNFLYRHMVSFRIIHENYIHRDLNHTKNENLNLLFLKLLPLSSWLCLR